MFGSGDDPRDDRRVQKAGARTFAAAILLATLVVGPTAALAEPEYTMGRKAGRGAAALFLGVLEIPGNIAKETRKNGPIRGATIGLIQGVGMLIVREALGLYELLTLPAPLPKGFVPIIEPELPWDYFVADDESAGGASDADVYESY